MALNSPFMLLKALGSEGVFLRAPYWDANVEPLNSTRPMVPSFHNARKPSMRGEQDCSTKRVQVPNVWGLWSQKTIPLIFVGTRALKYWVPGPSGPHSQCRHSRIQSSPCIAENNPSIEPLDYGNHAVDGDPYTGDTPRHQNPPNRPQ